MPEGVPTSEFKTLNELLDLPLLDVLVVLISWLA